MSAAADAILWTVTAGLCGGAVFSYLRVAQRQGGWAKTFGRVASIVKELHNDEDGHRYMYAPVVSFRARNGDEVSFQDEIWTGGPSHAVGERVRVLYDPADPQSATLAGWRPYFATLILACGGFGFLVMSVFGSTG